MDEKIKNARGFRYKKIIQRYPEYQDKLRFWNPELCALQPKLFDFIVTVNFHFHLIALHQLID